MIYHCYLFVDEIQDLPYIENPWKGITPLGGYITVLPTVFDLPFNIPTMGLEPLHRNMFDTPVSLEKQSIT